MGTTRSVVVAGDGEEGDLVAVGELRLKCGSLLEYQVVAAFRSSGGVAADRPETRGILDSELEGRKVLSNWLGGCVSGLGTWRSVQDQAG
jgi:hypothetical protein